MHVWAGAGSGSGTGAEIKPGYWSGPGGGGYSHFEGSYPVPNYRLDFLGMTAPQFCLTDPCILGVQMTALGNKLFSSPDHEI